VFPYPLICSVLEAGRLTVRLASRSEATYRLHNETQRPDADRHVLVGLSLLLPDALVNDRASLAPFVGEQEELYFLLTFHHDLICMLTFC